MGSEQSKEQRLEIENGRLRQKNAHDAQIAEERFQYTLLSLNKQIQDAAQRIAKQDQEIEIERQKSKAAKELKSEAEKQMEKQAELQREHVTKLKESYNEILRQQKSSNERQIQDLINLQSKQTEAAQAENIRSKAEQQEEHRKAFLELNNNAQRQTETHVAMCRNFLETYIEHSERQSRQQQEQHQRHTQVLQEVNEAERERSEKMLEAHNQLIQQFLSDREKLHEYYSKPPEKPIYKEENIREVIFTARRQIGLNDENYYNFGIAGHTKTGKSSLINAIRGLRSIDKGAAAVDFTECTQEISYYTFPDGQFPFVRLYDIPGSGTLSHNSESYYADKGLCAFDCLIIMVQQTLCQEDITFALQALKYNQPVAFVRSRCDSDLDNLIKQDLIDEINQEEINKYITKIAQKYKEQIDKSGEESLKKVPCYFVSAFSMRILVIGEKKTEEKEKEKKKEKKNFYYQEAKLLEYITLQSKHSRNIV